MGIFRKEDAKAACWSCYPGIRSVQKELDVFFLVKGLLWVPTVACRLPANQVWVHHRILDVNISVVDFQFGAILTTTLAADHNGIEPGTINLMTPLGQLAQVNTSQKCEPRCKAGV
jgi:hypothetical protein